MLQKEAEGFKITTYINITFKPIFLINYFI